MNPKPRVIPHLPTSDVKRMVDFYTSLGFTLVGSIAVREGIPVFARLQLNGHQVRIEFWKLADWEILRKGFSVTTLWIETDSVDSVAARLRELRIPFHGPGREDYGSIELELSDPEGFRIVFAEEAKAP